MRYLGRQTARVGECIDGGATRPHGLGITGLGDSGRGRADHGMDQPLPL